MIKFQIEKLDLEIGDLREVLRVEVLDQIEREEAVALEELSRACQ